MCTANKVTFVYAMNGADLNASCAVCAKLVVDGCKVVFDLDRAAWTSLLALHTADTSVCAILTGKCALFVVGALYDYSCGVVYDLDNAIGAGACAYAAANALSWVDVRYAILNGNSVAGADLYAIAVAEAGVGAGLVSVVEEVCHKTALGAVVVKLSFGNVTVSVAGNVSHLFNNVLCLYSEDRGDLRGYRVTARNAEVGCACAALGKSPCFLYTFS